MPSAGLKNNFTNHNRIWSRSAVNTAKLLERTAKKWNPFFARARQIKEAWLSAIQP